MNRLQRFVKVIKDATSDIDRFFLSNVLLPGLDEKAVLDDPYTNVSLVYTCISTTARAIAQVPLMVVTYDSRGNPIPVMHNHPWQQLFDRPNPQMNRASFLEALLSFLLLDGNVCIIPFPPGRKNAVPLSIWPIRWTFMDYKTDKNGHISKWIYKPKEGRSVELNPDEVLHLKFWNPNNQIDGLAPHKAGRLPILGLQRAMQYNQQFFENGAVSSGILHTDKTLSRTSFDRAKAQVNQEHSVKHGRAHKIMVLEQGLKWSPTGITHRDMEFKELHALNAEQVLQLYGMKKSIISITADLNFATANAERKEWWHGTCLPLMKLVEDTLAYSFFGIRGQELDIVFDISSIAALHEAFADKSKTAETLLRLGFTRNEVNSRLELGFPNVEWGDIAYMPVNMMPVNIEGVTPRPGGDGDNNPENPPDDLEEPENEPQETEEPETEADSLVELRIRHTINRFKELARPQIKNLESKIRKYLFKWRVLLVKNLMESLEQGKNFLETFDYNEFLGKMRPEIASSAIQLNSMALFLVHGEEKEDKNTEILDDLDQEVKNLVFLTKERLLQMVSSTSTRESGLTEAKMVLNKTLNSVESLIWTRTNNYISQELAFMEIGGKKVEKKPEIKVETPKLPVPVQPINLNITIPSENRPEKTSKRIHVIRNEEGLIQSAEIVED